jgi:hypothetical protein
MPTVKVTQNGAEQYYDLRTDLTEITFEWLMARLCPLVAGHTSNISIAQPLTIYAGDTVTLEDDLQSSATITLEHDNTLQMPEADPTAQMPAPQLPAVTAPVKVVHKQKHLVGRTIATIALALTGIGLIIGIIQFLATMAKGLSGRFLFNGPTRSQVEEYRSDKLIVEAEVMQNEIVMPVPSNGSSLDTLGGQAFEDALGARFIEAGEVTSVRVPETVRGLDLCAFNSFTIMTSVSLPKSLMKIGDGAFIDCHSLTYIHFPAGIKQIGGAAFRRCKGLKYILIPKTLKINRELVELPADTKIVTYDPFSNVSILECNDIVTVQDITDQKEKDSLWQALGSGTPAKRAGISVLAEAAQNQQAERPRELPLIV